MNVEQHENVHTFSTRRKIFTKATHLLHTHFTRFMA